MPTVGTFHTFYWEFSDTAITPVAVTHGGYPVWQSAVIAPSLFGTIGAWIDHQWGRLKWAYRLIRRIEGLGSEQQAVVFRVLDLVEHPQYPTAQAAVRATATTLGFNKPQAWVALSHEIKAHADWAENTWRHLRSCHGLNVTARAQGSTLTNPELNALVELAYQGFALRGR